MLINPSPQVDHSIIFHTSLAPMLIVGIDAPYYTMLDVNNAYLETTHTTRKDLIGKSVFGVFPANPTDMESKNIERTIHSFEQAIKTKMPHTMYNYRYDIPIPGTSAFEERYWTTSNTPVMDEKGEVIYFIHSPSNVTELYKLTQREQEGVNALQQQREQLHRTFMQAPVGIAILKGDQYIVDLINPSMCELYGKKADEMMGRPIFDVLTYARGIGFEDLLDKVRQSGIAYKGTGVTVPLERHGRLETVHLNFVNEPFRETDGSISGVIAIATEVTQLVQAKNLLMETEERARLAAAAGGLGTFDLNLLTNEVIASDKFADIFGMDNTTDRASFAAAYHPDDTALRQRAHAIALQTGSLGFESRVVWKDGSVHWVRIEGKMLYEGERPVRILGTALDITAERKAKEEQRKLISLVDNSVDLVSILNLNGVNAYINEAGRHLLGFDNAEDVTRIPVQELHAPEDFLFVQQVVIPSVMTTGKWSGTMLVRHLQTKEIFPVYNNCFRIDDPVSGEPLAVGAVMRDLRPELAAKQALADSEALLRNITTAAPTALWMTNENGAITYVNQTWLNWTGQDFAQSLGDGWLQAVAEADQSAVKEKFSCDFNARRLFQAEFRMDHADGTEHWCSVSGQPQYQEDGRFVGYIGACVDITEQKLLQKQKDDFIGIASHELKTPVTTIKGYAQILEQMLLAKGDEQEAAMMKRMDHQVKRLTSLIGDLLDVTKITAGKLDFNDVVFDFDRMLMELLEDLRRVADKHLLLTELDTTGCVMGDRYRIEQVITNLVTNAIKYSPAGSSIIIRTLAGNNELILSVQDYGIGIPIHHLEKVFEQFYRVSGDMQHTYSGLGLGLYISAEIIRREKGRIWVTSKEGEGSVFSFALPLQP